MKTQILDHGYINVVETWGIRRSCDRGSPHEHKRSTPFEMAGLIVEVQAPILYARAYQNVSSSTTKLYAGGVPKELARIHLPVGRYSRMRARPTLNTIGRT